MDLLQNLTGWLLSATEHGAHEAGALAVQTFKDTGYLWVIPALPALGAVINGLFGAKLQRRFGKPVVHVVAIGAMALSFLVACVAFAQMFGMEPAERYLRDPLWTMFRVGPIDAEMSFALDPLSMTMTLIITFVGALIHVYSIGYMAEDPAYWRFFCYLNLFVFSMLLLVMGDNFVLMFFGWEGVGLCSYLLIGFWYEDLDKAKAAVKAFITNRIGDFGFLLGLFVLFWALGGAWVHRAETIPSYQQPWIETDLNVQLKVETGTRYEPDAALAVGGEIGQVRQGPTLNFRELRDQLSVAESPMKDRLMGMTFFGIPLIALAAILLFVGATAKSAQIPLYVWLPDAMAGPTPVSALIHAATMVTAGVYMVARLNFLFALSPVAMTVVACIGAATALFAATIGIAQNDIKKVLAYSTVSQLGFMFIGVGVGAYWAGVFHLLTHAFFKATLFLGSGSVILGCHHEQDMRKMGGLAKLMPVTAKTYLYACIAIAGFPIANGFFSKDEILWKAFDSGNNLLHPAIGPIVWAVGWITATMTAFYMFRSYYMTFTGEYRGGGGHEHAGGHAPAPAPALATHSLGAAHAGTFDSDVAMAAAGAPAGAVASHVADDAAKAKLAHVDHPDHKAGATHGHGGVPKESPKSITFVLTTLAIGCGVTLLLGVWPAVGHLLHVEWLTEPAFERWLAPVMAPSTALVASRATGSGIGLEWGLMIASVAVAFLGWGLARWMYKDAKSSVPARIAARFPTIHRWMFNKYYVDELYQKIAIRPTGLLARLCSAFDTLVIDRLVNGAAAAGRLVANLDGLIDTYVVDGLVNATAQGTLRAGRYLRRFQTGRIQHYLYAALIGALLVIGINYLVR